MISIFSGMRHTVMCAVSKKKTLACVSMAIVACGLLIGCPEPATTGGGDNNVSGIPNLTITAMVTPPTVMTGSTAIVTVTVTNNGAATSSTTRATLYRSTDTTINTADTSVGTVTIPRVAAQETVTATLTIPATETAADGLRNYGACVPGIGSGSAICSNAITLAVTSTPSPDLNLMGTTPTLTEIGYNFNTLATISVEVTNSGTAASTANSVVRFYRQSGEMPNPTADGAAITEVMIPSIPSGMTGNTATATATFNVGEREGLAKYYAVVTDENDINPTNNMSEYAPIVITPPSPDLAVSGVKPTVTGTAPYTQGDQVTISVAVTNSGTAANTDGTVTFYRQAGETPAPATDGVVRTATLPTILTESGSNTATVTTTFNLGAGGTNARYYAVVTANGDSNSANNTSMPSDAINITAITSDLTIDSLTTSPTSVAQGGTFTANVVVRNDMNASATSPSTTVSFALLDSAGMVTELIGSIFVPGIAAGMSSTARTGTITIPFGTSVGTYFLRATVNSVPNESDTTNNTFRLGGTPSQPNFAITASTATTFNLASGCRVLVGDPDCAAARTAALVAGEAIGTITSTGATAFAIIGSNDDFAIGATTGIVTAKRTITLADFTLPTLDIMVTGGVGAGIQRVRIINDASVDGLKVDDTAQIGAPTRFNNVQLFQDGNTSGRMFACAGQGGGCITSYQSGYSSNNGWSYPYSSGVSATALDVRGYETIYIEYQLNNNTISGPSVSQFTLRLDSWPSSARYNLGTADGLIGNSEWHTVSIPLSRRTSSGSFNPRYLTQIGFFDQGFGFDLSVRAIYLR